MFLAKLNYLRLSVRKLHACLRQVALGYFQLVSNLTPNAPLILCRVYCQRSIDKHAGVGTSDRDGERVPEAGVSGQVQTTSWMHS